MADLDSMKEQLRVPQGTGALSWPNELGVFGLLFLFALLLRFPFFFPAVIDWDEGTQVLMGQSILDGYLPYIELWDNKPPLSFAFYALACAVSGKDLVVIRLAGTLCVVVTAFFVYLTGGRLWNRGTGMIAAVLCIAAMSLLQSGQATMPEHVLLVPLVGALYLLISREMSVRTMFVVGVLMATATLVRQNIGYVVIVVGLYILVVAVRSPMNAARLIAAYSVGGILVIGTTWIPYGLAGQQDIWWKSVITAPLAYSDSQYSVFKSLLVEAKYAYRVEVRWLNAFVWLSAVGSLTTVLLRWRSSGDLERRGITFLLLFMAGTGFGILKSGGAREHYMIQLAPFAALLAASLIHQLPRMLQWFSVLLIGAIILISIKPVFSEYKTIVSRALAGEHLRHGSAYEIAAYLRRENKSRRPVYLLTDDHIAYWLLDSYPPTNITHPSNIAKPYLLEAVIGKDASAEEELRKVFRKSPEFVVTEVDIWYLRGNPKMLLDTILAEEYIVAAQIEGRRIYRLKSKA
jgi:4-amino-4-deoxy-L-arabinose transferase-like glycosyltransferase